MWTEIAHAEKNTRFRLSVDLYEKNILWLRLYHVISQLIYYVCAADKNHAWISIFCTIFLVCSFELTWSQEKSIVLLLGKISIYFYLFSGEIVICWFLCVYIEMDNQQSCFLSSWMCRKRNYNEKLVVTCQQRSKLIVLTESMYRLLRTHSEMLSHCLDMLEAHWCAIYALSNDTEIITCFVVTTTSSLYRRRWKKRCIPCCLFYTWLIFVLKM